MTLVNTQTHLKAILDTLKGSAKTYSVTYDYPEPNPASFAAGYLILVGSDEEATTTQQNTINQNWIIRTVLQAAWSSAAYKSILTKIDEVIAALRKESNRTSGTIMDILVAPSINIYYTDQTAGSLVIGDIQITVLDLLTRG
jgi:hypothetical protein